LDSAIKDITLNWLVWLCGSITKESGVRPMFFLKLLADGQLFAADADLNQIDNVTYPIIKIIREDNGTKEYVLNDGVVTVISSGKEFAKKNVSEFATKATELLTLIDSQIDTTFESPNTEKFMTSIGCINVKSDSSTKRDITIILQDVKTGTRSEIGFSIKSRLGAASTLLNPGKTTNFTFSVSGNTDRYTIDSINQIDTYSKVRDRISKIKSDGMNLEYTGMQNSSFESNLQLIDGDLPQILSNMILYYYSGDATTVSELVLLLQKRNPCGYNLDENHPFYSYKIKHLLTDIALGMTPSSVWTGEFNASGGYIIVKDNGDIVCYHIYNYNEFQEYLLHNTKLETASTSKFDFGTIKEEDNKFTFSLNLQIRFLK